MAETKTSPETPSATPPKDTPAAPATETAKPPETKKTAPKPPAPKKAPKPKAAEADKATEKTAEPPTKAKPEAPPPPREAPGTGEDVEVVFLNLSDLHPFKNHPFSVRDDAQMVSMVASIKEGGVNQPITVRPREGGGFEIVSGHRRAEASLQAGFTNIRSMIRDLTDEQAIQQMVEDNTTYRETILPSERAKALNMQYEAIKRQGARDGGGLSFDIVGERNGGISGKTVQRKIDLLKLVPPLLAMVDEGKIKTSTAETHLAHISRKNQKHLVSAIEECQAFPSPAQAKRMKELDSQNMLKPDTIIGIMEEVKKEEEIKVVLTGQELSKYFGPDKTPAEMKAAILRVMDAHLPKLPDKTQPDQNAR